MIKLRFLENCEMTHMRRLGIEFLFLSLCVFPTVYATLGPSCSLLFSACFLFCTCCLLLRASFLSRFSSSSPPILIFPLCHPTLISFLQTHLRILFSFYALLSLSFPHSPSSFFPSQLFAVFMTSVSYLGLCLLPPRLLPPFSLSFDFASHLPSSLLPYLSCFLFPPRLLLCFL